AGLVLLAALVAAPSLAAQAEPPSTGGATALARELRGLGAVKRVLVIGAHPDDEDTDLLAVLALGEGAEAAYLSLSRGEGGQNLIGPELGEELGILRTGELLAARRTDGARQYFTRAYDFGYSKSLDEALTLWPRDSLLKDVVRIVRRFRPQVVVSIFRGARRDGHGQHQASGWAARAAFDAAGDGSRFPELASEEGLAPWSPLRLYLSTRFDSLETTARLEAGALDPVLGQSYHQIAMRSRSLHRSQDMGRLQPVGPSPVRLALLTDRASAADSSLGPFAGLDTTFTSALGGERARRFAGTALELRGLGPGDGLSAIPRLDAAWELLSGARGVEVGDQRLRLAEAERIFRGMLLDAWANEPQVVPGDSLDVTLTVWNAGPAEAGVRLELFSGAGWPVPQPDPLCEPLARGAVRTVRARVPVPADAHPSDPYFLRAPRHGALYDWSGIPASWRGLPFEPAPLSARLVLCGVPAPRVLSYRPVTWRTNDQATGEVRRPILVVPRVGVTLQPGIAVWAARSGGERTFEVSLRNGARDTTRGTVALELPSGWCCGEPQPFVLQGPRASTLLWFTVRPPKDAEPGRVAIRAVATVSGGPPSRGGVLLIDHPHVEPRAHTVEARATGTVVDLQLPRLKRVGYVRGAADRVPEALQGVGVPVEELSGAALGRNDLNRFDAIVVGPRAWETDSGLMGDGGRLVEYAGQGGLVIVQYQQQRFFQGGVAPFPLERARPDSANPFVSYPRVADETAEMRILQPDSPVFTRPHRIGPADWHGWVQERGLYFAPNWDGAWTPLLETADPGEPPARGGLLMARVGKGAWVYTGLSFFRQLPAGVPGAYRLFLNLLALGER
ncbi:MAG: PIG-L family deacetylase, partial [Gemmatimonadales bacterium]